MSSPWKFWKYALIALLVALGGGIAGTGVYDAMKGPFEARYVWFTLIGAAVFLVGFYFLLELAKEILSSSARELYYPHERQRRILVMGLSEADSNRRAAFADCLDRFSIEEYARDSEEFRSLVGERENELFSNWQQNIRAIAAHGSLLEAIYVLPSEESSEAIEDDFLEPLRKKLPDLSIKRVTKKDGSPFSSSYHAGGQSYENYAYVHDGLKRAVEQAEEDFGETGLSHDICIDVTAGQKTFSIAGAIVTLNNDILLGYVTTGKTGGKPMFYDMSATFGGMSM